VFAMLTVHHILKGLQGTKCIGVSVSWIMLLDFEGFFNLNIDLFGFDFEGFSLFWNKDASGRVRVKEVPNKDSSFTEVASLVP